MSIIIPCFNHGQYLKEAVDSTAVKDNEFCEVIIVNDGSNDGSTKEVVSKLEGERITVIHQENKGLSVARNVGVAKAKGEYILLLDADNLIDPQYYLKAAKILDSDSEIAMVYSDHYRFGKGLEDSVFNVSDFTLDRLLAGNFIDACAVFRKSVIDVVGGFDESGMVGLEDWEFWIRCWSNGLKFEHIPEPLFKYRVVEGSMLSQVNEPKNRRTTTAYIINKHLEVYKENAEKTILHYLDFLMHNEKLAKLRKEKNDALTDELEKLFATTKSSEELKDNHIQNLTSQINDLSAAIELKENHLKELEKQLSELSSAVVLKEGHIKTLETQQTEVLTAIDLKEGHVQSLSKEIRILSDTLKQKEKECDDLKQQAEISAEQNKQLKVQNEHALASIWQLQNRINKIEASKPYKLYKHLRHLKNIFRSNSSGKKDSNIFKKVLFFLGKKGRSIVKRFMAKIFKHLYLWTEEKQVYIIEGGRSMPTIAGDPYNQWLARNRPTETTMIGRKKEIGRFKKQPKFSIVMPVYNPKPEHFKAAVDSILHQVYENWELCLADDCSPDKEVKKMIKSYLKRDSRIKAVFRKENGHISAASNSGLSLVSGDYVVLMDQDDVIPPDALFYNAKVINENDRVDLIYSDEDKFDDHGIHSVPHFKPDWSPDNLLSRNYLGHLTVFDAGIFKRIGGWREGYEGSQDYDLVLRFAEQTDAIFHIPRILYHWRIHETSASSSEDAKPYAYISAKKALTEALVRRNEPGAVDFLDGFRGYSIRYDLKSHDAKVSIVIPTKDQTKLLKQCIRSIFELSTYKNIEVIVVDNNSSEKAFFEFITECENQYKDQFTCVEAQIPFNFSTLVNKGVEHSTGEYVILLNNDTETITEDWIEGMLEQAQRESIGVVGAKLLYENQTIQHAGVVIGLGGAAGHVLVGEDRHGPGYFNYVNLLNNYSAVTAACIMIRKSLYDELNGFDESFSVEYNDVDFCLRVREAGYNNIYVPHVELIHYESISRGHPHASSESYERHLVEIARLKERWSSYIDHDPCYNPNLSLGAHDFSLRF